MPNAPKDVRSSTTGYVITHRFKTEPGEFPNWVIELTMLDGPVGEVVSDEVQDDGSLKTEYEMQQDAFLLPRYLSRN